jgi:RNA polymerase sigma-54 factor
LRDEEIDSYPVGGGQAEEEFDPLTLVAADAPLADRVLADLAAVLPPRDLAVAELLLHCLDERGYLDIALDRAAAASGYPVAAVERVLRAVQAAAPPGVAARDPRECLLLQLDHWRLQAGREPPAEVGRIIADHLDDLAAHRYVAIARCLRVSREAVEAARDFIRSQLSPYPLQGETARSWVQPSRIVYVTPDAIIHWRDDAFLVEVVESSAASIRLNPVYAGLAAEAGRRSALSEAEREHLRHYLTRARLFMTRVNQRRETLRRLTECLVELQGDFLREGVRSLRPLTRSLVAARLGVHESTISRATADKHVMLPNRQVVPYATFFKASLSVKDAIRELITAEQGALTDRDLSDRLRAEGYRVARRTIAKYRAQLGILPSTLR